MKCPYCESDDTRVIDTAHETTGPGIRRRRECNTCSKRFSTLERAILDTPMVVKSDGRREPFDRVKLLNSMRMSWSREEVDERLHRIMILIHRACHETAEQYGTPTNLVNGANIAGFLKVANAMMDQGLV